MTKNCNTCRHYKHDNLYCECCFDLDKYEKERKLTNQEAITIIGNLEDKDILFNPCDVQDAKTMAIKALSTLDMIRSIINLPHIQEDVIRYKMICEVVDKHTKGDSE